MTAVCDRLAAWMIRAGEQFLIAAERMEADLLAARWDQFVEAGVLENAKTGVRQRFLLTDDL